MEDNFWLSTGNPTDLESPPSGKLLKVKYSNGDYLNINFDEIKTKEQFQDKYKDVNCESWDITFPLTVVEIHNTVGGTEISFGPRETRFPGMMLRNNFMSSCNVGIQFGLVKFQDVSVGR